MQTLSTSSGGNRSSAGTFYFEPESSRKLFLSAEPVTKPEFISPTTLRENSAYPSLATKDGKLISTVDSSIRPSVPCAVFDGGFYSVIGEREELERFIRERPDVQAFLRLIPEFVLKHFGAKSAELELCTDPENGKVDVCVHINHPFRSKELRDKRKAFFNELCNHYDELAKSALHDVVFILF